MNSSNFSTATDILTNSLLNSLSATSFLEDKHYSSNGYIGVTGIDLGKARRRLGIGVNYDVGTSDGNEADNSIKNLNYENSKNALDIDGKLFYYEPLGRRWGMQATLGSVHNSGADNRDAFNSAGVLNTYHTSSSNRKFNEEYASVLLQYSNDTSKVKLGVKASARSDVSRAVNIGQTIVSGKDVWKWNISPVLAYDYSRDGMNLNLKYSGETSPVSSQYMIRRQILPILCGLCLVISI